MRTFIFILVLLFTANGFEYFVQNSVFNLRENKFEKRAYLPLRIMTFNIWNSGANVEDGLYKIAKHIRIIDPDIVALQVSIILTFLLIYLLSYQ